MKKNNITILRKTGWVLNPSDDVINKVLNTLVNCPCYDYLNNDKCECGLYLKLKN